MISSTQITIDALKVAIPIYRDDALVLRRDGYARLADDSEQRHKYATTLLEHLQTR